MGFSHGLKILRELLLDALRTAGELFRIIVPVAVATRLLELAGAIEPLGEILAPVMRLVGLPGELGLVWATTLVTNLYGGMVVYAELAPAVDLTIAQVTVLTSMMLIAHALPVELSIAQKAGPRMRVMVVLRLGGALVYGVLLNQVYLFSGTLQQPTRALWTPPPADPSWGGWGLGLLETLTTILLIIFCLLALLRLLDAIGITGWLTRNLAPLLRWLGMGKEVAPVTIIGMSLGISYGGGLILREVREGSLDKRDLFLSLALMGLCHSVIEDTLVMVVMGGHLSGIFFGRIVFALVVVRLLMMALKHVPETLFERWVFRSRPAKTVSQA